MEDTVQTDAGIQDPVFWNQSRFKAAYDRRLAEFKAVPDDQLVPVNVDIQSAVAMVLASVSRVEGLRAELVSLAGHIDQHLLASLGEYAEALSAANVLYEIATSPPQDVHALNEAALTLREVLKADATALATRDLIDPGRLAPFKGLNGYKNVASELMNYAYLMREHWAVINGRTALTAVELQHAIDLAERLLIAAGKRELDPVTLAESARVRQQAFTLMLKAYTELRRVLAFLRFYEGDAETIAPSLWAGRGTRSHAEPAVAPANAAAAAPAPAAAAAGQPAAVLAAAATTPVGLPVGYPGGSPYLK